MAKKDTRKDTSDDIGDKAQLRKLRTEKRAANKLYNDALDALARKDGEIEAILQIKGAIEPISIRPHKKDGDSEAVVFMVGSDWHVEEKVLARTVNGLNSFNLGIAEKRAEAFFKNGVRLTKIVQKDISVKKIVLALLGDFISGSIHEELVENNTLSPIEAIIFVQNLLAGGINYILKNTDVEIEIICHSGNHARITKTTHYSTESGNSLEYGMYHSLALHFKNERRVKFHIADGYHSFCYVYEWNIRFHHGHAVRYGGGVGGLTIPANKAIAQWNKGMPKRLIADLDVFGHFHQFLDVGGFICNGSLIGYNAFAKSIKASYEEPRQAFFVIDKKRGKTFVAPIILTQS